MNTLKKGASGPEVVTLQDALTAAGFAPGASDGFFGPNTETAVMAFQESMGLTADGVVGANTWSALELNHTADAMHPTDHLLSGGIAHQCPKLELLNHCHPSVAEFKNSPSVKPTNPKTEVLIHESVSYTLAGAVSTLKRKGYGVQLAVDAEGNATQHGDLVWSAYIHAGRHNNPAVGIEVINPYYGEILRSSDPWDLVIDAPWAHKGRYVVPTRPQAEKVCRLVKKLTRGKVHGLDIPRVWHMVQGSHFIMGVVDGKRDPSPGIYAHYNTSTHSDGCWPALYCFLRMQGKLKRDDAYDQACLLAQGAKGRIDVSMYL